MGSQQSQVVLDKHQVWEQERKKQQTSKNYLSSRQRRKLQFYQIQSCEYPHPIMKSNADRYKKHKRRIPIQADREKEYNECKRTHADFGSFKLCTDCQKQPQHIRRQPKLPYEKIDQVSESRYDDEARIAYLQKKNQKKNAYKDPQANTYGPQTPLFFNGFSLPVDKYNRQKPNFSDYSTDFTRPQNGRDEIPFFNEGQNVQESVFESDYNDFHRYPRRIDNDGYQQNLPF